MVSSKKSKFQFSKLGLFVNILILCAVASLYKYYPLLKHNFYKHLYQQGFKVEKIYINELKFLTVEEVIDKLDFAPGDPIMQIDLQLNQKALQESFWIKKSAIKVDFPNVIRITIYENVPEFIWYHNKQYFALDNAGRILKYIDEQELQKFSNFIIVTGKGVRPFVPNLFDFIKMDQDIYNYIAEIEWISNRRWDIIFINDLKVKLPELNPRQSWKSFVELNKKLNFFSNKIKSVDLRIKDRLFIELDLKDSLNKKILKIN